MRIFPVCVQPHVSLAGMHSRAHGRIGFAFQLFPAHYNLTEMVRHGWFEVSAVVRGSVGGVLAFAITQVLVWPRRVMFERITPLISVDVFAR